MTEPRATDDDFGTDEDEYRDYANCSIAGIEDVGGQHIHWVDDDGCICEVNADEYRLVDQYEAARRRQAEAEALAERRWRKPAPPPPPPEPEPEAIPPAGKLTARQEEFCRSYAAQPVAARAAVLAGYAEENATNHGSRLLKNPIVLARIAALRAERNLRYVLEPDTLQDKLEAVFFDALTDRNHAAAVAALRLQAGLGRLPTRPATAASAADAGHAAPQPQATKRRPTARKAYKSLGRRRKKPRKAYKSL
ncbi:MAG TPA: terminase small subunit [Alphaproteobacteria bacterium]|jgi:hypothetical protein